MTPPTNTHKREKMNDTSKIMKKWGVISFFGLIAIINASLTFAFGFTFGGVVIPLPWETVSHIVTGMVYLIFLDASVLAWFVAKQDAKSNEQRAVSTVLFWVAMVFSVLFSVAQLAYTTPLIDLSGVHSYIGYGALFIMCAVAGGHFIGIAYYQANDPEFKRADIEAAQRATLSSAENAHVMNAIDGALAEVETLMAQNMPAITRTLADEYTTKAIQAIGFSGTIKLSNGKRLSLGTVEQAPHEGLVGGGSPAKVEVPAKELKGVEKVEVQPVPQNTTTVPHDSSIVAQEIDTGGANFP